MASKSPETIAGVRIPRRRFTVWAAIYFVLLVAVPVIGIALVLDLVIAEAVRAWFGACWGLFCFLE